MRNPCFARMGCHFLFVEYQHGTNVDDSVFWDTLRSKYTSSCEKFDRQKGHARLENASKIHEQVKYHINAITYAIITFGSLRDYDEARSSSQLVAAVRFIVRPVH